MADGSVRPSRGADNFWWNSKLDIKRNQRHLGRL